LLLIRAQPNLISTNLSTGGPPLVWSAPVRFPLVRLFKRCIVHKVVLVVDLIIKFVQVDLTQLVLILYSTICIYSKSRMFKYKKIQSPSLPVSKQKHSPFKLIFSIVFLIRLITNFNTASGPRNKILNSKHAQK
jgi:hypothetical protein